MNYIEKHNLIYSSQYGFRKGHSTQHAILDIVNTIQANMNQGLYSCGVFIDLKKAFDTVDHKILLDKLNFYGFRGLINQWFSSYLNDRTQTTQIADHISNKASPSFGVPQGSVLGPLLFLLYVNDIHQCSNKLKFYLFADDTNILFAEKRLKVIETVVNSELHKLYDWLTSNKLTLNISKSSFVIFHPKQKKANYKPKICLFDNEKNEYATLESKEYIKYLGILIDKNLTWKHHIDTVSLKISKSVGLLAKLRHFVPQQILLKIYQSLIYPYIIYGLAAWGQAAKTHLNKILLLQKRALRIINFSDRCDHAIPLFIDANILPINFLYYQTISNLMHDVHNNMVPSGISDMFQKISNCHYYKTRASASGNLYVNSSKLELYKQSFSRFGAKLWNEIPCNIRQLPKNKFKATVRNLLFDILHSENDYIDIPTLLQKVKLPINTEK